MPVYTYRCENCDVQFERTQKFTDAALTRCPECGKKSLRKVYTPVGIVFKGSGFYATDHRSASGQGRIPSANGDSKPAAETKSTETVAPAASASDSTTKSTTPPPTADKAS